MEIGAVILASVVSGCLGYLIGYDSGPESYWKGRAESYKRDMKFWREECYRAERRNIDDMEGTVDEQEGTIDES